jgi:hypothetical protein
VLLSLAALDLDTEVVLVGDVVEGAELGLDISPRNREMRWVATECWGSKVVVRADSDDF